MKVGVVSDTHGDQSAIRKAVAIAGVTEMWLHAGDCSRDGNYLAFLTGLPVLSVKGNCDSATHSKGDEFFDIAGKKIWLTHGHRHHVKDGLHEIGWWGRQYGMDVVIYGHTHSPTIVWDEKLLLFNPGSAAYPHGNEGPTCGLLEFTAEGSIMPRIIKLMDRK